MEDEINTSASAETDDVQPEQTDTAPDWDFYDPEEDTVQTDEAATDDDGSTDEAEPETLESDTEDSTELETEAEAETQLFDLPDGGKIDRDEAIKGYLRQSDYTRKSTENAEMRKVLEAENQRMQGVINAFTEFLKPLTDSEPDAALAHSNPQLYMQQRAQHEANSKLVKELMEMGEKAQETQKAMSDEDMKQLMTKENRLLAEKMPQTLKPEARQKFFNDAYNVAETLGFSSHELNEVTDHRMFMLAHWAKRGMEADAAAKKAKAKAAKAPPATPNKPGQSARRANNNAEAMRRLSKSGSIQDALLVDFD